MVTGVGGIFYLNAHTTVAEAKAGIGAWLSFYNGN